MGINTVDGVQFGLVLYSAEASVEIELGSVNNVNDMVVRINALSHLNSFTNTYDALDTTRTACFNGFYDRQQAQNIAILVTDGIPTVPENEARGRELAIEAGQRLLSEGVLVYSVGITNNIDEDLLRILSSEPKQLNRNYFTTPDFNNLGNILEALLESTCQVATTPRPPAPTPPPYIPPATGK